MLYNIAVGHPLLVPGTITQTPTVSININVAQIKKEIITPWPFQVNTALLLYIS